MENRKIMKILNNIRRLKENPVKLGFNDGWNSCLDTLIMDFEEEIIEKITHTARKLNGRIYIAGKPHKISNMKELEALILNSEIGFETNKGRFVDGAEAGKIAFKAKQINEKTNWLYSDMIDL